MYKNELTNDVITKPSIEALALPTELRRTHNFASRARPIIGLDLPLKPSSGSSACAALNFTHAPPRPGPSMPETDFLLESRLGENDTAYGLPASWREPKIARPQKRHRWSWSERSIAAFSGFAGGLIVVLPLIFILSNHSTLTPAVDQFARTSNFSFAAAAYIENLWNGTAANAAPTSTEKSGDARRPLPVAAIETKALKAISTGKLDEARRTLRTAASPENPRLWLLLAQTYDRETNAASNAAATTSNEIEFARFYYRQALTYGIEAARPRLEALSPR